MSDYKLPMLFREDLRTIDLALTIAIKHLKERKAFADEIWIAKMKNLIADLEATTWKELPTPNTLNK
jgi:hypothetical protein